MLREIATSYFGLYLVVFLAFFSLLKLLNAERFRSIVFFWERTSSNAELNKPFNKTKAFSFVGFALRGVVFGLMAQAFWTKSFDIYSFNISLLWWSSGFMLFWIIRTLYEYGLVFLLKKQKGLLKIFYIRSIFKEKWAFVFYCFALMLVSMSLPSLATQLLALSYAIGLILIHIRLLKLYFRDNPVKKVYIILYICASEIGPLWVLTQTLIY
jgi:hypothetical protein